MTTLPETTSAFLEGIARDHLSIEDADHPRPLSPRAVVSRSGMLGGILREAYEAGYRAATARELGVTDVVFNQSAERFPWQVFCTEERCVLISRNHCDHMLIVSEIKLSDRSHRIPIEGVSSEQLEVIRRELYGARR